ncbi:hypothetical protein PDESU_06524 [Pontiella desulfatans]|uniref:Uncharacterized protein n=1 Tax=Pontiella desulfatans TaxID=2750659 RepID=A0A6C2UCK7_PONDE|nr:hypothetical protein [Pontiella desulfatans]VGO17922.1 hypothetical protein PDESU_06524 [Pontiella desulfatans]
MKNVRYEFSAPWGRLLMGMSGGVVVLFVGLISNHWKSIRTP